MPLFKLSLIDTANFADKQQVMKASLTSSAAMQHCGELSTEKRRDGCNVISPHKKAMIRDVQLNERMLRKKQSLDKPDAYAVNR